MVATASAHSCHIALSGKWSFGSRKAGSIRYETAQMVSVTHPIAAKWTWLERLVITSPPRKL